MAVDLNRLVIKGAVGHSLRALLYSLRKLGESINNCLYPQFSQNP